MLLDLSVSLENTSDVEIMVETTPPLPLNAIFGPTHGLRLCHSVRIVIASYPQVFLIIREIVKYLCY